MRHSLFLLLLVGCTTIDSHDPPPLDFPSLKVVSHYGKMPPECGGGGLMVNIACTVPDFCSKTCNIYYMVNLSWVKEHEELHCKGYDHPKPDWQPMRTSWENWKLDGRPLCQIQMGYKNYCAKWPEDTKYCR